MILPHKWVALETVILQWLRSRQTQHPPDHIPWRLSFCSDCGRDNLNIHQTIYLGDCHSAVIAVKTNSTSTRPYTLETVILQWLWSRQTQHPPDHIPWRLPFCSDCGRDKLNIHQTIYLGDCHSAVTAVETTSTSTRPYTLETVILQWLRSRQTQHPPDHIPWRLSFCSDCGRDKLNIHQTIYLGDCHSAVTAVETNSTSTRPYTLVFSPHGLSLSLYIQLSLSPSRFLHIFVTLA